MIGTDIVKIDRVTRLIQRYDHRFLDKVFTAEEQEYCNGGVNRYERYAGRFAAKEAIRKALQPYTEAQYIPFLHIEILPDNLGAPIPALHTDKSFRREIGHIAVSISHERQYAIAFALVK